MVSAFGSTDTPTTNGYDPVTLATTMAQWVIDWGLDGIDVDWEDFAAMNLQNGQAEYWLISFTETLRSMLPAGQYLITHAPVAPWFSGDLYPTGAYVIVNENAGYAIDWYNLQFYNQGATEYANCTTLIDTSTTTWPHTAIFQINFDGEVPLDKLVIGKPAAPSDATNGYMDTSLLATCVQQAMSQGWSGGVMTWEYPDAAAPWIAAVRADSWPV
ncbi:glycoside hydrolase family 18 protein [Calocera cornea HHB12733]|uniref:Glycoside hydrolase family 18 protein n=1 Tax=Calocera cornea HHB12733 TaxID=1353952 RepID=A0A165D7I6_9BASI|nr:glycoside hydrolase family 18 protein [Calocera cornea HHB12733]